MKFTKSKIVRIFWILLIIAASAEEKIVRQPHGSLVLFMLPS